MIFYIIDFISDKIKNLKNKKKLKIFFIWITLLILVTVVFYLLGAFESKNNLNFFTKLDNYGLSENNIYNPLKSNKLNNSVAKSLHSQTRLDLSVPALVTKSVTNNISDISKLSKNNSFRNVSHNNKLYDVVPKNEVSVIDEVLSKMRNIPSPHIYQINDYNFE